MRKLVFILLIAHCSLLIVNAQQPTQEWVRRYSGLQSNYGSRGLSVKLDSIGNVYVLAPVATDTTLSDFCVIKYSPSGTFLWQAVYNSPGNLDDGETAFAVTPGGDVYVTGGSGINFTGHILTLKFNSSGQFQWARTYNGGGSADGAVDIALDRQGNIIIVGGSAVNTNTCYALTIKYNPYGDSLWVRKFMQYQYSYNNKLVIDDSSSVYITGYHRVNIMQDNFLTLKYNWDGNLKWFLSYGLPPVGGISSCIAIDSNRNVYVAGNMYTQNPTYSAALVKINPYGDTVWTRIYSGIGGNLSVEQPVGIGVTSDGTSIYYTLPCSNGLGGGAYDIVTLKYNSAGDSVWVRRYGTGIFGAANVPASLKLDKNNNIYITSSTYNNISGDDYVTIKYLPNGIQQWVVTYNGPLINSGDYANNLIIDTNLNVYVTGVSSRQNQPQFLWDAATIKYNQPIGIIKNSNGLPQIFVLAQNYPNPFNSTTIINYELPCKSFIEINLYNELGQLVKTLVKSEQNAGYYTFAFNFENFSSGIYFYSLKADNYLIGTKKLIIVK